MKRLFLFVVTALVTPCLSSCSDGNDNELPEATVSIEAGPVSFSSLTFTIKPVHAVKCAYVVIRDGESVPSAAEIIASGKATDAAAASIKTEEELVEGTKYRIVAAVLGASAEQPVSASIGMETSADPAVVFDPTRGTGKIYGSTNNIGITLRTAADDIDYELSLDLYDDSSKTTRYLGEGTYEVSTAKTDKSLNSEFSYLQKDNDQFKFKSGNLVVKIVGKTYSMRLTVVLSDDQTFVASFNGEIDGLPIG